MLCAFGHRQQAGLLSFALMFSSCREEQIPSYIHIPAITVAASPSEGSASSNITDAWVYHHANLQGVYPLPVQFPLLAEGNVRLIVFAGVKYNGIAATRGEYPFYAPDTIDLVLRKTIADTVFPVVRYSAGAVFDFIEDFESGSLFGKIQRSTEDVFEGSSSGKLTIADSNEVMAVTLSGYSIPFTASATFLEMDYKNNHVFEVGIRALTGSGIYDNYYKLTVPPRNDWNKLYVNFTAEVNQIQADAYHIYFRTIPQTLPDSVKIYFDNLKLIHSKIQ